MKGTAVTDLYKALESLPEDFVNQIGQEMACVLVPRPQDFPFTIVLEQKVFARLLRMVAEKVELSPEDVETILARGDQKVFLEF